MAADLLQLARSGDRDAFAALVEPYRGELHLMCYRMLGSLQDAEDTVQEILLSAWMGLDGFEGRSSVRTWLHRIATNRCLNALRAAVRKPAAAASAPPPPTPQPSRLGELPWLQPYPDLFLDALPDRDPGPEARYETREAISLAFITAVQLLPPNQRAVLLLRDVLGYHTAETADLLELTGSAVNSALKRARATLQAAARTRETPPVPGSPEERALTDRFVTAFTGHDVPALIALMTDDVWVKMPPLPFEYRGIEAARLFFTAAFARDCTISRLIPTRANGQPAWGEYGSDPLTGRLRCTGVLVATYATGGISELTHFETTVAPYFGLPRTLT
ncbi:MAG TPA: sigma-70 family RNA polymerase sigma factor [Actinospica sp.]|jgi:RNA polymerase sigma-70 factor (ECF subfamily)|nr:sigma-70 family RNA polymerase sigma factor [Actinospica sp.]